MRWLFLIGILYINTSLSGQSDSKIIDQVVAQVGDEIILLSDIENNLKQLKALQEDLPPDAKCYVLENLMVQKLLVNQAKLDSIVVTDSEVENNVTQRINQILAYMKNDRNAFVEFYGKSPEEVQEEMKEDMRSQLLGDRMKTTVLENITITPSEAKAFFNAINPDSLPFYSSEVEVSEIVVTPVANAASKDSSRQKLQSLVERINNGESFAELARRYSHDIASGADGGDLGWSQRGQFVPQFEAAAYKLEKGEISPIIETEFGYHVLQLNEKRGNLLNLRHILITPEIEEEDELKAKQLLDSVRNLILIDSLTFEEAVLEYSDENEQSYNNGGRLLNPATASSYFEVGDLDPDVYFTINSMKVGEISPPVDFVNQRNETKYRILRLESKTTPHQANFKQDFAKIQDLAKQSKQNEFLAEWIKEKITDTFFTIDDLFQDCANIGDWQIIKE